MGLLEFLKIKKWMMPLKQKTKWNDRELKCRNKQSWWSIPNSDRTYFNRIYAVFPVGRWRMVSPKSAGVVSMTLAMIASSTTVPYNNQIKQSTKHVYNMQYPIHLQPLLFYFENPLKMNKQMQLLFDLTATQNNKRKKTNCSSIV